MNPLEALMIHCPYCGESIEIEVDCSAGRQEYIEDCTVCCQPINLIVECNEDGMSADARRDDEC